MLPTLTYQTLAITVGTACCTIVPFAFGAKRGLPRGLLPLATGMMTGLCCFGLLPEAGREGGALSLALTTLVAVVYSLLHLRHLHHRPAATTQTAHAHDEVTGSYGTHVHGDSNRPLGILATAIFVHSLLDGSLLVISTDLFTQATMSVTVSLWIHKAFEALSLASLVYWRVSNRQVAARWLTAYVLSFPCGVFLTFWMQQLVTASGLQRVALIVMSVAIGNLIGCLIFDFILPSIGRFKYYKGEIFWLASGFAAATLLLWEL